MSLERALDQLEGTVSSVDQLVQHGQSTKNRAKLLNAVIYAKEETQTFIQSCSSAKFNEPRKQLKAVSNTLQGLENGLGNKEFGSQYLQATLKNMDAKYMVPIRQWAEAKRHQLKLEAQSPEQQALEEALNGDFSSGLEQLKALDKAFKAAAANNGKDQSEMQIQEEIQQLKAKAKKYMKLYAPELTKPVRFFQVVRLPLVAAFENYRLNDPAFLTRVGIKHTKFGPYYTVFEKQTLIAVSRKAALAADGAGSGTAKSVKTRKSQLTRNKKLLEFVDQAIDQMNERSSVQYSRITEAFLEHPTKSDIFYVWIMPTAQAKKLRQDNSKGLKMVNWGFPWTVNELTGS